MLWGGATPRVRPAPSRYVLPRQGNPFKAIIKAVEELSPQLKEEGRFLTPREWTTVPDLLVKALNVIKSLPESPETVSENSKSFSRVTCNLVELSAPVDMDTLKNIVINRHRLDIEQAVALVIRILPEFAADLVRLVPTIMTQSSMWLTEAIPTPRDPDLYRRKVIFTILSRSADNVDKAEEWDELAPILFRIRRRDAFNASRCLRLPDWLHKYYPGDRKDLEWNFGEYPTFTIANPIVVSRRNFGRLTRRLWRVVPNAPDKVLRRTITSLSKKLVYGDDARKGIKATHDRKALAYTFIAIQRRLQLKIVSDLHGRFLGKGEMSKFQQNTPYIQTNFEEKLGEIAVAGDDVDWTVLTAVQRPKGVEGVDEMDELLVLVDRICECFEWYVEIYGKGHTETLRPQKGRRGGFRGPVDDWNAAVDILAELRRRINDAGYQVISEDATVEEDGFAIVPEFTEESAEKALDLPRVHKFLALDIMSWNNSWGDDVFALEKMPPQWWTWLEKRRAEGKCPLPATKIVID
jgi:hypothetical protein